MNIQLLVLLSIFCGLSVLAQPEGLKQTGFDVNDVSLLFPLKDRLPYPAISLESTEIPIVNDELFSSVLLFESPDRQLKDLTYANVRFVTDRSRWFITSMRIDDCGDNFHVTQENDLSIYRLSRKPTCRPRLRVVAQPFNFSGQPLPSAFHFLVNLESSQMAQALGHLQKVKAMTLNYVNTIGMPLQIHPGLLAESKTPRREIADAVIELLKMVRASHLEVLTLTLGVETFRWKMVGGIVKNGQWTRFVTDYSQKFYDQNKEDILLGVEEIKCNFYDFCATFPKGVPQVFEDDNVLTPALSLTSSGALQAAIKNKTTETMAEIIEDSEKTHFFNTNCISCHVSSSFRNRNQVLNPSNHLQGLTPFTLKNLLNHRPATIFNFGYEGLSAVVSTRTANESLHVADRINRFLNLKNPAPMISRVSDFWKCLMQGKETSSCFNN